MVAEQSVAKSRQCTAQEHYFARLLAYEGYSPTRAYRIAWKSTTEHASDLGPRVLARPHVAARIAELRDQADREGQMQMAERRRLLAETARSVPKSEKPSHGERIAAIKLDAELAGEYRQEIGVGGEITVTHVLRSLGGDAAAVLPQAVDVSAEPVSVIPERVSTPEAVPALESGEVAAQSGADAVLASMDAQPQAAAGGWTDDE